jgi:hypothetical protein
MNLYRKLRKRIEKIRYGIFVACDSIWWTCFSRFSHLGSSPVSALASLTSRCPFSYCPIPISDRAYVLPVSVMICRYGVRKLGVPNAAHARARSHVDDIILFDIEGHAGIVIDRL